MVFFSIFILFSLRRVVNKTISIFLTSNNLSNELEIRKKENISEINTNNLTELLSLKGVKKNIIINAADGIDQTPSVYTIRKNISKLQFISFLEDSTISDIDKIEKIRENKHVFDNTTYFSNGIYGYRICAGGFDDYYDFMDILL
jgi:hypothetical protein